MSEIKTTILPPTTEVYVLLAYYGGSLWAGMGVYRSRVDAEGVVGNLNKANVKDHRIVKIEGLPIGVTND